MGAAVEAWVLWWLAAIQLLLAWLWWRGPHLPRTRGWVTGLFLLNGIATWIWGIRGLNIAESLWPLGGFLDRWTDLFLAGAGLAAIRAGPRIRALSRGILGLCVVALALSTPLLLGFPLLPQESFPGFLNEFSLHVAIVAFAVALATQLRRTDGSARGAWILMLAVLGARYADLSAFVFVPHLVSTPWFQDPWQTLHLGFKAIAFMATVFAFGLLLVARLRIQQEDNARIFDVGLALILGGFLMGAGRVGLQDASAVLLTFALVRPIGFVLVQCELTGTSWLDGSRWGPVAAAGALMVVSLLGIGLSEGLWDAGIRQSLLVGSATLILAAPLVSRASYLFTPQARGPVDASARTSEGERPWPVEEDRVTLPGDWRDCLEEGYQRFLSASPQTREALAGLTRWQRIMLALYALGDEAPMTAYGRTTPGLHLATHCPYSNIGPEIRRTNGRASAILEELGLETDDHGPVQRLQLIEGTWGTADGLDSSRVKLYRLTPLGRRVAQRLCEQVGLEEDDRDVAGSVIAEGFVLRAQMA